MRPGQALKQAIAARGLLVTRPRRRKIVAFCAQHVSLLPIRPRTQGGHKIRIDNTVLILLYSYLLPAGIFLLRPQPIETRGISRLVFGLTRAAKLNPAVAFFSGGRFSSLL